jgi:hypothetical protein
MMSSSSPEFALAYVRELSADFIAGVVLDAPPAGAGGEAGGVLAGTPALEPSARALLAAHPHAAELHGVARDGTQVFAARSGDRVIVVVAGPLALPALMRSDVRTALSGNVARTVQEAPLERPQQGLIDPLATAAADAFRP